MKFRLASGNAGTGKCQRGAYEHGCEFAPVTVINGEGLTALPGLIDAHTHVELSMLSSASFAEALIQNGTTAAVLDPHDAVNVLGHKGAKYLILLQFPP